MNEMTSSDRAALQAQVLEEARKVLKCETVEPADHFLDLGGDSLTAPILARRIQAQCGARPALEEIFTMSFGELADLLCRERNTARG